MPDLLLEIGVEELPASACREALAQLPELCRKHVGVEATRVFVGPRRLALIVESLPERTADSWIKGPPATMNEQAIEGFARKHGTTPAGLVERDGMLGVAVRCPVCAAVSVNLVSHRHVDLPFWNDPRVGVVEHVFGEDVLRSVGELRSELYSSRFDERRLPNGLQVDRQRVPIGGSSSRRSTDGSPAR